LVDLGHRKTTLCLLLDERAVAARTVPLGGLSLTQALAKDRGIDLGGMTEPVKLFDGSAREAAMGFPANLNVAAALGLAGIGPDRTQVEIWADPDVTRNTHEIEVRSDSADFRMRIENIPSEENPRTGKITALSVIAALRKLAGPIRIAT
ncbi:MAG: DUF108 domain-containing protein, partial [Alphaproteobacteria bacterium]|nr:DUF108 domain-containing protein [Alphaproteobacteria bacterium]